MHNGHRRVIRIARIPKAKRFDVTRQEFDDVTDRLNLRGEIIEEMQHDLDIQFQRIAQIQVELDEVRAAWSKIKPISKS